LCAQDLDLAGLKAARAAQRQRPDDGDPQTVRQRKVATDVQRCLLQVAQRDLAPVPVLHRTWTVNAVTLSRDLGVATVYWTAALPLPSAADVRERPCVCACSIGAYVRLTDPTRGTFRTTYMWPWWPCRGAYARCWRGGCG
jgi:hypothetical protein